MECIDLLQIHFYRCLSVLSVANFSFFKVVQSKDPAVTGTFRCSQYVFFFLFSVYLCYQWLNSSFSNHLHYLSYTRRNLALQNKITQASCLSYNFVRDYPCYRWLNFLFSNHFLYLCYIRHNLALQNKMPQASCLSYNFVRVYQWLNFLSLPLLVVIFPNKIIILSCLNFVLSE